MRWTRISVTDFFAPSFAMYSRVWISPTIWMWAPLVRPAAYSAVRPKETHFRRRSSPPLEDGYVYGHLPTVTAKELEATISLFKRIRNRKNKEFSKRLSIALRRLNSSSLRTNEDDGLLDAMIGMEALLSPESTSEMTHKIALRMAGLYKLLNPPMAVMAFGEIKKIYAVRSKIVHGGDYNMSSTIQRRSDTIRIVDAAVEHLKAAMRILIDKPEYFDVAKIDHELVLGNVTNDDPGGMQA